MIIARLKDGYTLEQAKARADSAEPKGPSPWENYGGVADLVAGGHDGHDGDVHAWHLPDVLLLPDEGREEEPCGARNVTVFHDGLARAAKVLAALERGGGM